MALRRGGDLPSRLLSSVDAVAGSEGCRGPRPLWREPEPRFLLPVVIQACVIQPRRLLLLR